MLANSDFAVPKVSPMRMSNDAFQQPSQMSMDFNAPIVDRSPVREDFNPATSARGNKDRMDPAMMKPAGAMSSKGMTSTQKYSAHHTSEMDKFNDFSSPSRR